MTDLKKLFPKVAIVADQLLAFGGAERELISILKILPHADIYTIAFAKENFPSIKNRVYTSFVQKIFPRKISRHLKIFTPFVYENFDLHEYDLVISISAGPAKGVITGINQPHLAMVLTPPRSLWDNELNVRGSKLKWIYKPLSKYINNYMRIWDLTTSKRIDYWIANSQYIAKKIMKIYKKEASVIYPGVSIERSFREINIREKYGIRNEFFLVVSRLYDYKKIDWAIRSCMKTNKDLVIIGDGPDSGYLKKIACNNPHIKFLGFVKDDIEVQNFYKESQALLFCGVEDFGLIPVESMTFGTPVLAYKDGGLLETNVEGVTGEFFQTEEDLQNLILNFDKTRYNSEDIIKNAKRFSEKNFLNNLENKLIEIYAKETSK